jgi:hypothetical protein
MSSTRFAWLAACLLSLPTGAARAQQRSAAVQLSFTDVQQIAADVDGARDGLYCYYGHRVDNNMIRIFVDSVAKIASRTDCHGLGMGFIARVPDREFLVAALRGVIEENPALDVVTAFYRTEQIERDGEPLRAPRSLSVVRATRGTISVASARN